MNNCKNCNSELNGNYCSNCGNPAILKRIDLHYIKNETSALFYLEKGFFYTIKELIIRPGQNIRKFIAEDRNRLVKPITFLIVTSLIYTLIVNFFDIEEEYTDYVQIASSAVNTILNPDSAIEKKYYFWFSTSNA